MSSKLGVAILARVHTGAAFAFAFFFVFVVVASLGVQAGCAGGPLGEPVAEQQVTSELCAHAARCDDIGSGGRSYPSLAGCLGREAALVQTEWGALGTCLAIETRALDDCLTAIRSTSCGGETGLGDLWIGVCAPTRICGSAALP
jgi:hypothetical protein